MTDLTYWKISDGHISTMRYLIHFMHACPLYMYTALRHYSSLFTHMTGDWRLIS